MRWAEVFGVSKRYAELKRLINEAETQLGGWRLKECTAGILSHLDSTR